jgi:hypothetical protein
VSQWQLLTGENEDNQGFNGGDDKQKKQLTRRHGRRNPHLESTAQPPTKRRRALAPIIDERKSPYYRDDFINSARRTNEPDPVIDHVTRSARDDKSQAILVVSLGISL